MRALSAIDPSLRDAVLSIHSPQLKTKMFTSQGKLLSERDGGINTQCEVGRRPA